MYGIPGQSLTLAEYYQLEASSETKHEYYRGIAYAMTGASMRHNLIVANTIGLLHAQLLNRPCTVFPSDLRLKIEVTGLYTYPDASVLCDAINYADLREDTVANPTVIIEVLSPSTENYDRGNKYLHYRTIPTLREYLIIAQEQVRIEHYLRHGERQWLLEEYFHDDQQITLRSIGCQLTLSEIYAKVSF